MGQIDIGVEDRHVLAQLIQRLIQKVQVLVQGITKQSLIVPILESLITVKPIIILFQAKMSLQLLISTIESFFSLDQCLI
jgi:hypothetical protein